MIVKIGFFASTIITLSLISQPVIAQRCSIQYSTLLNLKQLEQKNERWFKRKVTPERKYIAIKQQIDNCVNQWKDKHIREPL